jgi:hypothetical protein
LLKIKHILKKYAAFEAEVMEFTSERLMPENQARISDGRLDMKVTHGLLAAGRLVSAFDVARRIGIWYILLIIQKMLKPS